MSIIQKLENTYVAILRVVVIAVATILLVVAAILGVAALKDMLHTPQEHIEPGSVDTKDVLADINPAERLTPDATQAASREQASEKANPYAADYEKAYAAVAAFVDKTSRSTLKLDKLHFFKAMDENLNEYDSDAVKANYISGLAEVFKNSLTDKRLIARVEKPVTARKAPAAPVPVAAPEPSDGEEGLDPSAEQMAAAPEPVVEEQPFKESPYAVVNDVLNAYNKMFKRNLADALERQNAAATEHMIAKASASTRMYVAAGIFGTFLLVIFLMIAIRIERNLKEIAARS